MSIPNKTTFSNKKYWASEEGQKAIQAAKESVSANNSSSSIAKPLTRTSLKDTWAKEEELNKTNMGAIQGYAHQNNYIVIDKAKGILTVYSKDNKPLAQTNISTGLSRNDYNTITYTDKNGELRDYAGNNSTPAGITEISSVNQYYGYPSYQRARYNANTGKWDSNIASAMHIDSFSSPHESNGCVRIDKKQMPVISQFIGPGTRIYTLPEQPGSRFKLSEGQLNYVADNPYGNEDPNNPKRHWDDYNTYTDKSAVPIDMEYTGDYDKWYINNNRINKSIHTYLNSLEKNKEAVMKEFGFSSETYDKLALLAAAIANQETRFGHSFNYKLKNIPSDDLNAFLKKAKSRVQVLIGKREKPISNATAYNRSRGISRIKNTGDNQEMQKLYKKYGIDNKALYDLDKGALATMLRLGYIYNTEARGRTFQGANGPVSWQDVLIYKWNNHNEQLKNHTATPDNNKYIKSVRNFLKDLNIYKAQ